MKKKMKRIFLTGLAVVIPAGLTIYILFFIIDVMDNLLRVIPDSIITRTACSGCIFPASG